MLKKKNGFLGTATLLMIGTFLSKVLGFLREWLVTYKFGVGAISDAFIITNSIPTIIFSALSVGIATSYIPVATSVSKEDEKNKFTSNLINICTVITLIGAILIILFPKVVLLFFASGFKGATYNYAIDMIKITAFSIIPIMTAHILQAYLQLKNRFIGTALYGIIVNLVLIGFVLISSEDSAYLLSVGMVVANSAVLIFLWYDANSSGYKHHFSLNVKDRNIKKMAVLTAPILLENVTYNLHNLVDKNLASHLNPGSITGLNYGSMMTQIINAMITTTIITIIFPRFSKLFSNNNIEHLEKEIKEISKLLLVILTPLGILLMILAYPISEFLFLHGNLDAEAVKIIGDCSFWFGLGLMPLGMKAFTVRIYYSLHKTKESAICSVISLLFNIIFSFLLIRSFKHNGIAFSTSLSYYIGYFLLIFILQKKYKFSIMKDTLITVLKLIISTGIAGIPTSKLLNSILINQHNIVKIVITAVIFLVIYCVSIFIMRVVTINDIKEFLSRYKKG